MKKINKVTINRVRAFLIDYAVVLLPTILLVTAVYIIQSGFSPDAFMISLFSALATFLIAPYSVIPGLILDGAFELLMINLISFSFVYSVYCLIMELTVGKTVGAKTEKLECVNDDLQRPNKKAILLRNFWKFISFACLFLGLIPALFGERKTLYDILSKTQVVKK